MNEKLHKLLAEVFEMPESNINADLKKDDIDSWDSLKQMDLVVSLEENFETSLEMEEIVAMDSIAKIIEILEGKGVL